MLLGSASDQLRDEATVLARGLGSEGSAESGRRCSMSHKPEGRRRWLCPERLPESRGGARMEEETETGRGPCWAGAGAGLSAASVRRFRQREQRAPKPSRPRSGLENGWGWWMDVDPAAGPGVRLLYLPAEWPGGRLLSLSRLGLLLCKGVCEQEPGTGWLRQPHREQCPGALPSREPCRARAAVLGGPGRGGNWMRA